jgi:hypothetical protein
MNHYRQCLNKMLFYTIVFFALTLTACGDVNALRDKVKTDISPTDQSSPTIESEKVPAGIVLKPDFDGQCNFREEPIKGTLSKNNDRRFKSEVQHLEVFS